MMTVVEDGVAVQALVKPSRPRVERIAWEYLVVQAAGIWLVTRLALAAFSYYSLILTRDAGTSGAGIGNAWYRWDAINYVHIATSGYVTDRDAAFFPLYPVLIALGSYLVGHPVFVAMIISNLGTLAAFIGVALLVVDEGGDARNSRYALLAIATWPLAFFLTAGYTEGIFIALAVWCLWSMRRGNWYLAAAFAFFAALCRSTGVILLLPLLYEFARQHGWIQWLRWRNIALRIAPKEIPQLLAIVAAIPFGIGIFCVYCLQRYGAPLEWLSIESAWGRVPLPIWESIFKDIKYHLSLPLLSYWQGRILADDLPVLFIIIIFVIGVRKLPLAYTLYLAGLIYLTMASPRTAPVGNLAYFGSGGRFMLVAVPAFMLLGKWFARFPTLGAVFFYGGTLLQAALLAYFLKDGWIV